MKSLPLSLIAVTFLSLAASRATAETTKEELADLMRRVLPEKDWPADFKPREKIMGRVKDGRFPANAHCSFINKSGTLLFDIDVLDADNTLEDREKRIKEPRPNMTWREYELGDRAFVVTTDTHTSSEVYYKGWCLRVDYQRGEAPPTAEKMEQVVRSLNRQMFINFTGSVSSIANSPEFEEFLGMKDPSTPKEDWEKALERRLDDLARRAGAFPGATSKAVIEGETNAGVHSSLVMLPENDLQNLLVPVILPEELAGKGNVFAAATVAAESKLREKILAWRGAALEPADILFWSLQANDGSYPLAVLTAHNFLKNVTYKARWAQKDGDIELNKESLRMDVKAAEKRREEFIAIIREQNQVISRLASLRQDPAASRDKMGPWYHIFGVLTMGAFRGPGTAADGVFIEHHMKWLKSFQNEAAYDPEKHAIDKAFVRASQRSELKSLNRVP